MDDAGMEREDTELDRAVVDPESLRALAVDTRGRPADDEPHVPAEEEDIEPRLGRWRRLPLRSKLVLGAAGVPCLAILALAIVRAWQTPAPVEASNPTAVPVAATAAAPAPTTPLAPTAVVVAEPPAPAPPEALPKSAAPAEDTAEVAAQRPTTATITLSASAQGSPALLVDGRRAKSRSVDVTCGKHTVALGKGKPRQVDVPCGRTALVDGSRITITKSPPPDAKSHSKR